MKEKITGRENQMKGHQHVSTGPLSLYFIYIIHLQLYYSQWEESRSSFVLTVHVKSRSLQTQLKIFLLLFGFYWVVHADETFKAISTRPRGDSENSVSMTEPSPSTPHI